MWQRPGGEVPVGQPADEGGSFPPGDFFQVANYQNASSFLEKRTRICDRSTFLRKRLLGLFGWQQSEASFIASCWGVWNFIAKQVRRPAVCDVGICARLT